MTVARARHSVDIVELLVDCAAAYRLTRLVTADKLTATPRRRFVEAAYVNAGRASAIRAEIERDWNGAWDEYAQVDPDAPKLATLVTCRWCTGVYVAAGVMAARLIAPRQWGWAARTLTAAAAAALLAGFEDE